MEQQKDNENTENFEGIGSYSGYLADEVVEEIKEEKKEEKPKKKGLKTIYIVIGTAVLALIFFYFSYQTAVKKNKDTRSDTKIEKSEGIEFSEQFIQIKNKDNAGKSEEKSNPEKEAKVEINTNNVNTTNTDKIVEAEKKIAEAQKKIAEEEKKLEKEIQQVKVREEKVAKRVVDDKYYSRNTQTMLLKAYQEAFTPEEAKEVIERKIAQTKEQIKNVIISFKNTPAIAKLDLEVKKKLLRESIRSDKEKFDTLKKLDEFLKTQIKKKEEKTESDDDFFKNIEKEVLEGKGGVIESIGVVKEGGNVEVVEQIESFSLN